MEDKDVITESSIITDPLARGPKKPIKWRMIIVTVALGLFFVATNYLSYHLGYMKCQMDDLSRSITEMTEKAEVLERHGTNAEQILNRMLKLADEAVQRAEDEFEEGDPARVGE